MNLNFVLNDYVLIWNLLFNASISQSVQSFKQKLWKNYRHSYNDLYKEEEHILKDPKNYIPNDDTIFDMVKNSETYQEIREETEKYRLELLHTWDSLKKDINKNLKEMCLVDQEFIKNPDETVGKYLGEGKVLEMVRFQVGEGMQKREENFAEEVAAQMKA